MPGWLSELGDRVVASDPGMARLRMALSAAVGVASTLVIESGYAAVTHANAMGSLIAMLLGAVLAMMGSMALTGTGVWRKVRTAVFFPVALGTGMAGGAAVGNRTDLMLAVFVPVMCVAVFVRRFGVAFFFYGFMCWMGYFFASFLHATMAMLPSLLGAAAVATAWILLLSVSVLRTNPARTLRRTVNAFGARARALVRACADMLAGADAEPRQRERLRRRLHVQQVRLAEAALMVEAWSADPGADPANGSAAELRRRLIDAQHLLDRLVAASDALVSAGAEPADVELAAAAARVADRLARRDDAAANRAAYELAEAAERTAPAGSAGEGSGGWWPARHFATAALEFVALARTVSDTRQAEPRTADDDAADEFEPVVDLAMGNLPGSAAMAGELPARGSGWNPLARLELVVRQAIQAALAGGLAILAGSLLSPTRYYWAVIAAFVMFAGTATRSETFIKGANRVAGTLVGLFASIGLAELTAGHTSWVLVVIVGCVFCGLYLIRVSYAYMIFFITIMLGQLYSVLHLFSPGLLVLRLEETAIGAAIGFGVALVVTPLSTRETVRVARNNLLDALTDLLNAATDILGSGHPVAAPDLDALSRTLDDRLRQLALVAKPLTRPLLVGNSPRRTRHRLILYGALVTYARELAVGLRSPVSVPAAAGAGAIAACHALATAVTRLAEASPGDRQPAAGEPLARTDAALFGYAPVTPGIRSTDPVLRPLIHLEYLLHELTAGPAQPGERPPATPPDDVGADGAVGALAGRFTAPDGAPIGNGLLLLLDAAGQPADRAVSDGDGRYRLTTGCPAGRYVAVVIAPGYRPAAARVHVAPAPARDTDFTLVPAPRSTSTITGTVYGPAPTGPLPHAALAVLDDTDRVIARTDTDHQGRYRVAGLPAGRLTIVALDHPASATPIHLDRGQYATADLVCGTRAAPRPLGPGP